METKLLMDVEEYLHTSFDNADCEYLDGEVVERNMGEGPHADIQGELILVLREMRKRLGIVVLPKIRIQISERRFRVPDVAVWRAGYIIERIPTVPPFLAIEILSSEDRMVRMQPKIAEYFSIGVEYVWVIDPSEAKAVCYSKQVPTGEFCDVLRTGDPYIEVPLSALFNPAG
ncbi:MAG: Uma2 family endonuclease [Acidobacteriota bacterium]|nr:Uma2 family endonuclease [Acidobacteriota bacterium]